MQSEKVKNSTNSSEIRNQWTPEQRVNAGQAAAQALNAPIINVVHDLLSQRYYREWMSSQMEHPKMRESRYYQQLALSDVMREMVSMVTEAQQIVEERQKQHDPVEQERQRMDEQGYGLNFNQKEMS
jgi:hypothetical protein